MPSWASLPPLRGVQGSRSGRNAQATSIMQFHYLFLKLVVRNGRGNLKRLGFYWGEVFCCLGSWLEGVPRTLGCCFHLFSWDFNMEWASLLCHVLLWWWLCRATSPKAMEPTENKLTQDIAQQGSICKDLLLQNFINKWVNQYILINILWDHTCFDLWAYLILYIDILV